MRCFWHTMIVLGCGLGVSAPASAQRPPGASNPPLEVDTLPGVSKGPGALPTPNPYPEGPLQVIKPLAPGEMPYHPNGPATAIPGNPVPTTAKPLYLDHYPAGPEPGNALYGKWDNGLVFESADKNWLIHVGGRMQFMPVFWSQPKTTRGTPPGNGGIPAATDAAGNGLGRLDDGMFFRRVRLRSDGVGYGNVEYAFEVNFEQLDFITYDHMWAGFKDIPGVGTVRIGQHKVPQGLEMMGSDYHLTFLERSSLSDAFWTLFAPGIFVANDFHEKQFTAQTMLHRIQPTGVATSDFGDGNYAWTSRVTWNPIYTDDGSHVLHVGASYQWRKADLGRTIQPGGTGNAFADTQSVSRFRARPELRDATGIGPPLGGDPARFIDTGFLLSSRVKTFSPEILWIYGPFSFQAEAACSYVTEAKSVYPASQFQKDRGTPMFWGGYFQMSYFLTGEHRGYDRRFGTFDRPTVKNRFNPKVIGGIENCDECQNGGAYGDGWGAWEVAYRYSHIDLNDKGITGGILGQHTLGVNWYFNDNFKLQLQYSHIERDVVLPARNGSVHGLGLLSQWYF